MAPLSLINAQKSVEIPGLLDGNIMVLIYSHGHLESNNILIADFAKDL